MPAAGQTGEELADPDPHVGASPPDSDRGDAVLAAERAHLRASREFLHLMREHTLSLRALGGDRVSEEYLKADLYRRAEALKDIPGTPLFFGRLDYFGPPAEHFHIGRRHVHDQQGHPTVIDWRAPVSRPFYRATPAAPMGLSLRRRFGFSGGELTAYEDEDLAAAGSVGPRARRDTGPVGGLGGTAASRILVEEIERPRVGPMRDIVATIQPDQDDIVRADAGQTVCVQGAPGTGKTAVGLHRVAYLLYAYPERMRRGGVLVVGPNRTFLGYIRDVLPALGEMDVSQVTVAELVMRRGGAAATVTAAAVGVRSTATAARIGPGEAERIKGDARMAQVLRRALWSHIAVPAEALVLARGTRRWRVPGYEVAGLVDGLRERGVRYGAGRELLAHRIAHVILTRMEAAGEPCDDRTHDSVRRSRPVRAAVDATWPAVDPVRLVMRVLSDPGLLATAADGLLAPAEQQAVRWRTPPRGVRSVPWTVADVVLIDEAADLIERTASLNHLVVDEAQDLSPMECRAIGRRCATGSATVLGDIAQGTTPWASRSWQAFLGHLGKPDAHMHVLDRGYRVPRQIIDYASRLLPHIAPGLAPPVSVRQSPGSLEIVAAEPAALGGRAAELSAGALREPGSVAVIGADDHVPELVLSLERAGLPYVVLGDDGGPAKEAEPDADPGARLSIVPVTLAKGLEFDQVIVVEPVRITRAGPRPAPPLRGSHPGRFPPVHTARRAPSRGTAMTSMTR